MNNVEYLVRSACALLEQRLPLVIATIITHQGSTPRTSGTQMVIGADGKTYGTIGGSLLEANAIQQAQNVLTNGRPEFMEFDLTNQDVTTPGMICGGNTLVLLDYVPADEANREIFRCWQDAIKGGKDLSLLTFIPETSYGLGTGCHYLALVDGSIQGDCHLPKADIDNILSRVKDTPTTVVFPVTGGQIIVTPFQKVKTLYCFGAGHVAQPTVGVAALAGFRTVVLDDRAEFVSQERFPDAAEIYVIDDFNRAMENLKIDADSFIIILTRSHLFDRAVLRQSLKTSAGYIGMIASRKKRDTIYTSLRAEGVTEESLKRVHSPIGINIEAETTEEIAISIVAELILERATLQNK